MIVAASSRATMLSRPLRPIGSRETFRLGGRPAVAMTASRFMGVLVMVGAGRADAPGADALVLVKAIDRVGGALLGRRGADAHGAQNHRGSDRHRELLQHFFLLRDEV